MTATRVETKEASPRLAPKQVSPELKLEVLHVAATTSVVAPQLKLEAKAEAV